MSVDHRDRWNRRYADRQPGLFGDAPAPLLQALADPLERGSAVEMGCGEGRNCGYLAACGWSVTGIDFSDVAIRRATDAYSAVTFVCADVVSAALAVSCDLGCAVYLHTSPAEREVWFDRLVDAIRPGGHLIYVGHAPTESDAGTRPPPEDLRHDALSPLRTVRSAHDHELEPGHRAQYDFGVLWRRV